LFATVASGIASANLMPASGHQDHTASPSAFAPPVLPRQSVHRIPLRVRDVAQRPSEERDGESINLFLANGEAEYFSQQGWTAGSIDPLICPSGKSSGVSQREWIASLGLHLQQGRHQVAAQRLRRIRRSTGTTIVAAGPAGRILGILIDGLLE
jgi:hypothetical protein